MRAIGYQHLIATHRLGVLPPQQHAMVAPVQRVQYVGGMIQVPSSVAPNSDRPIDHLLFALKHEGTDLAIIAALLPHLDPADLLAELAKRPSGGYIRKACYVWERLSGQTLDGVSGTGVPVKLFDETRHVVSTSSTRDAKWRVDFNGLGSWAMCPSIRRTPAIEAALANDVLKRAREVFSEIDPEMMDRAMAWAYLNETKYSFAIERETPVGGKAEAFARLLRQAWEPRAMDHNYLTDLQNAAITNPLLRAFGFRTKQNHLQSAVPGAAGVSYVPPPPGMIDDLMQGVLDLANGRGSMPPLVRAALASFSFVYVHPYMDGNGRLSRFLLHYVLAKSGEIPERGILPISAAMKRNELDYLRALQSFSRPARELWDVTWIDGARFDYAFKGSPALYRFWDATQQVQFTIQMAEQALQRDLIDEVEFLDRFDRAYKAVDRDYDIPGQTLAMLIRSCEQHGGTISKNRRKQYAATVPEDIFDAIQTAVREAFFSEGTTSRGTSSRPRRPG